MTLVVNHKLEWWNQIEFWKLGEIAQWKSCQIHGSTTKILQIVKLLWNQIPTCKWQIKLQFAKQKPKSWDLKILNIKT
jgi:hypothetical protein